jgi:phosphoribosyl-ATP pyrophosphohydrolase/phosphoribosyl-AMP cyclohydrolase
MLKLDGQGLVPAIIQDDKTNEVLMLGYMNAESLRRTVESGNVWFYSRSRQKYWLKGETSGNFLRVRAIFKDCDNDTILVRADPVGPVCHLNTRTCFVTEEGEMRGLDPDDTR